MDILIKFVYNIYIQINFFFLNLEINKNVKLKKIMIKLKNK